MPGKDTLIKLIRSAIKSRERDKLCSLSELLPNSICHQQLIECLSHEDLHLRAAAALILGDYFRHNNEQPTAFKPTLSIIESIDSTMPDIAGPFLDGLLWSGIISASENWNAVCGSSLNKWIVARLLARPVGELNLSPVALSLDFIAHEKLSEDADAIEKLINGKHYWLALHTATESNKPIEGMENPLSKLAKITKPPIAWRAALYLASTYHLIHPRMFDEKWFFHEKMDGISIYWIKNFDDSNLNQVIGFVDDNIGFTEESFNEILRTIIPSNELNEVQKARSSEGRIFQLYKNICVTVSQNHVTKNFDSFCIKPRTSAYWNGFPKTINVKLKMDL